MRVRSLRPATLLPAALLAAALAGLVAPARAAIVFEEDFSDNSAGWVLGVEWQIGPAAPSTGHASGTTLLKASPAASWKAMSDESTVWKEPSYTSAVKSTSG